MNQNQVNYDSINDPGQFENLTVKEFKLPMPKGMKTAEVMAMRTMRSTKNDVSFTRDVKE